MASDSGNRKFHFILTGAAKAERFRSPNRPTSEVLLPTRSRTKHGRALLSQLRALHSRETSWRKAQESAGITEGFGLQVEFESYPDIELAFESLSREQSGIELLNVRRNDDRTFATVFVPDGKLQVFEKLVKAYLDKSKDSEKGPRNRRLIDTISAIREATVSALWTDAPEAFPKSDKESIWWEIWLPANRSNAATLNQFRSLAAGLGLTLAHGEVHFPERAVLLANGTARQIRKSMLVLNSIAELRRAKDTAEFFDGLDPTEQTDWVKDLKSRLQLPQEDDNAPKVCLLDTGVNSGHPLLSIAFGASDLHSVEPGWGTDDTDGHGTAMAGLALVGDLSAPLASRSPIDVGHRLESVKLLPASGANGSDPRHHGFLTVEAVARPEVSAPSTSRVFCMAVTARDNRDRGRPSAWSAAVDGLAADAAEHGETPRLMVLSAGNVCDQEAWPLCPTSNSSDAIHDPGQSWNALTVGAFTNLVDITESDASSYKAIASKGGLSPFSTTSATWQSHWPVKPDVVFEGGNAACDSFGAVVLPSLSLLTTYSKPLERLLTTANATSAASALCARMAAQLMANYPSLWPETIRALIVHSAEWTDAMRKAFLPNGKANKSDVLSLARHCGFGVPDLERAMWTVDNSLTIVSQDSLQPFSRDDGGAPRLRDMHVHRLPWPENALEELGEAEVEMRVTLSYFIEPNPSERGFIGRYRYESHGLRFEVKRPAESESTFRARINAAARDEEEYLSVGNGDPKWLLGKKNRHRGSLHSDVWRGTAADLASRGVLAIYPTLGWWKTRPRLSRFSRRARYALVVTITTPKIEVDLYSEVASKIGVSVSV